MMADISPSSCDARSNTQAQVVTRLPTEQNEQGTSIMTIYTFSSGAIIHFNIFVAFPASGNLWYTAMNTI